MKKRQKYSELILARAILQCRVSFGFTMAVVHGAVRDVREIEEGDPGVLRRLTLNSSSVPPTHSMDSFHFEVDGVRECS
ncbi:MAG: hypothetical protein C5B58_06780 [Acidobacteria bacterium]|nr:MAG: hypothetical protein C5B58_06780 [Acidobacteriota bacterium]